MEILLLFVAMHVLTFFCLSECVTVEIWLVTTWLKFCIFFSEGGAYLISGQKITEQAVHTQTNEDTRKHTCAEAFA